MEIVDEQVAFNNAGYQFVRSFNFEGSKSTEKAYLNGG